MFPFYFLQIVTDQHSRKHAQMFLLCLHQGTIVLQFHGCVLHNNECQSTDGQLVNQVLLVVRFVFLKITEI